MLLHQQLVARAITQEDARPAQKDVYINHSSFPSCPLDPHFYSRPLLPYSPPPAAVATLRLQGLYLAVPLMMPTTTPEAVPSRARDLGLHPSITYPLLDSNYHEMSAGLVKKLVRRQSPCLEAIAIALESDRQGAAVVVAYAAARHPGWWLAFDSITWRSPTHLQLAAYFQPMWAVACQTHPSFQVVVASSSLHPHHPWPAATASWLSSYRAASSIAIPAGLATSLPLVDCVPSSAASLDWTP